MTVKGIQCPCCKEGLTAYVALIPRIDDKGGIIYPHQYAVCPDCYRDQYAKVYPDNTCPV